MPPPNEERLNDALHLQCNSSLDFRIAELPPGDCKDPCDFIMKYGGEAFKKVVAGGIDAIEYKFRRLVAQMSGGGVNANASAVRDAVAFFGRYMYPRIDVEPDTPSHISPFRRGQIVVRLANLSGLTVEETRAILDRAIAFAKADYERHIARLKENARAKRGGNLSLVGAYQDDPKRAAAIDLLDAIARDEEEWDPPQPDAE